VIAAGLPGGELPGVELHQERLLFWLSQGGFPPSGRISPDYFCMDGTIPRAKLPLVLSRMPRIVGALTGCGSPTYSTPETGNLHPSFSTMPTRRRAERAGVRADIRGCASRSVASHRRARVGVEKRDLMPTMFSEADLRPAAAAQMRLRRQGPAQPRKCFPAASLRRSAACMCTRKVAFPTFRGLMTDTLKPRTAKDVEDLCQSALSRLCRG